MKTLLSIMILLISTNITSAYADGCGSEIHVKKFEKIAEQYFMQMDVNNDGSVNKLEFEKSEVSKMVNSFDVLQPDENGFVHKIDFIKAFIRAHTQSETEV